MILEFDLGNTRYKWRLRDGNDILLGGAILNSNAFELLESELANFKGNIEKMWVASVVGRESEDALVRWGKAYLNIAPEFARASAHCGGVTNGYADPAQLGVDRWLGILASYHHSGRGFILVSFGTAITIDLVVKDGRHAGGFIAPGISLMLDSLQQKTHQVRLDDCFEVFDFAPGRSTTEAVHSAIAAMLIGLIENGAGQLRKLNPDEEYDVIFAGGDARKMLPFYPHAQHLPDLVLDGLAYILDNPK